MQQLPEGRFGPTKCNDIGTFDKFVNEHRGNNTYVIQEKTTFHCPEKYGKKWYKLLAFKSKMKIIEANQEPILILSLFI